MSTRTPRSAAIALLVIALTLTMIPLAPPLEATASTVASVRVTTANLNAVEFVTDDLVVAVGASGTVVRSTGGGAPGTWVKAETSPGGTHQLQGVSFLDENRGWTISQAGNLFYTADSGRTWTEVYPGHDIFPSGQTGVVYDLAVAREGEVVTSGDQKFLGLAAGRLGGSSSAATVLYRDRSSTLYGEWAQVFQAKEYLDPVAHNEPIYLGTGEFYSVDVRMGATDPERAWVAGHDRYQSAPTVAPNNNGFVWSRAYDSVTQFSGTWQSQDKTKFANTGPLYGISFGSSNNGVVVGSAGKAWCTTDAGTTWTATATGVANELRAVDMSDANRVWAVGDSGRVVRSINGGATWTAQSIATWNDLRGVAARSGSSVAVAVGTGGAIHYTSDGASWQSAEFSPAPYKVTGLTSPSHPDSSTWVNSDTVSLAWDAGSDIAGYSYVLDALSDTLAPATVMTEVSSASETAPSSGVWYARARAYDVWGQWGDSSDPITVQVDIDKPVFTHNVDPSGYTELAEIDISVADAHSGVSGFQYRIDGGSWVTVPGNETSLPAFDTVGTYTLEYRATDVAGNTGTGSASVVVRSADAPAPPEMGQVRSTSHPVPTTWYKNSEVALDWDVATGTGITGYWYSLDPAETPYFCTEGTSGLLSDVPSGEHTVYVRAKDAEVWSAAAELNVRVDVTAPRVSATVVSQQPIDGRVRLDAIDDHVGVVKEIGYRLAPTGTWTTASGASAEVKIETSGTHTIYYSASDNLGNVREGSLVVILDLPTAYTPIAGDNRYQTAAKAVAKAFPTSPMALGPDNKRTVILASGGAFPDALAASGLAGVYNAPLLLTNPTSLHSEAKQQILRLKAEQVIIVGGTVAVSARVDSDLVAMGITVERLEDTDRYSTARKIANRIVGTSNDWDGTALVATGRDFPDALAAAPIAAAKGQPLYLFDSRSSVNAETIKQMAQHGVKKVVVLGGESVVSPASFESLENKFGSGNVVRRFGIDRYATALDVVEYATGVGLGWTNVALATGQDFPDALAGGVMQGKAGSVMLLTRPSQLSDGAKQAFNANSGDIDEVRFLGGTAAISTSVRDEVRSVVK